MECKEFLNNLDAGGEAFLSPSESRSFREHAAECKGCLKAAESQKQLARILNSLSPTPAAIDQFNQRVILRLTKEPGGFPPILNWLAAGITLLITLAMFLILLYQNGLPPGWQTAVPPAPQASTAPAPMTQPPTASPAARLVIAQGKFYRLLGSSESELAAPRNTDRVAPGAVLRVASSSDDLSFSDGTRIRMSGPASGQIFFLFDRMVAITGEGTLTIHHQRLGIDNGKMRLAFTGPRADFGVDLPRLALTIHGTVIRVEVGPKEDIVILEEGKITWRHLVSGQTGQLKAGGRIRGLSSEMCAEPPPGQSLTPGVSTVGPPTVGPPTVGAAASSSQTEGSPESLPGATRNTAQGATPDPVAEHEAAGVPPPTPTEGPTETPDATFMGSSPQTTGPSTANGQ